MNACAPLPTMPEVSVVMSCFNDQRCIEEAVHSICGQSFSGWELIVINDGSTDQTGRLLDRLASEDSRIRVIHQANAGLTAALIRGCGEAMAPVIARQDADDVSHPDRLAMQLELLRSDSRLGLVSCFANYVGPAREYLSTVTRPLDPAIATDELLNRRMGPPAHGTVMFRRCVYEQVGGYRLPFYYAQDADLWLRMAEVSLIGYAAKALYDFRWHTESITGSGRCIQKEFGLIGQRCRQARTEGCDESPWLATAELLRAKAIAERELRRVTGNNRTSMNYQIGSQLVRNGDVRGRHYLHQVVSADRFHWRAWVRLAESYIKCGLRTNRDLR